MALFAIEKAFALKIEKWQKKITRKFNAMTLFENCIFRCSAIHNSIRRRTFGPVALV